MKKLVLLSVTLSIVCALQANAQITGSMSDWFVNLNASHYTGTGVDFADWTPYSIMPGFGHSANAAFSGDINGINYTIWDGYGVNGYSGAGNKHDLRDFGGQGFDVKAIYMKSDEENIYFGIVTGNNPAGQADPYGRSVTYRPGDIAINPNLASNTAEFGILMPIAPAGSSGLTAVISGGTWNIPQKDQGFPNGVRSNYQSGGENLGMVASYHYAPIMFEGLHVSYYDVVTKMDTPLYLLEASAPISVLGLETGESIIAQWAVSCSNDALATSHMRTMVPEPATWYSLLAIVPALAMRFRKK